MSLRERAVAFGDELDKLSKDKPLAEVVLGVCMFMIRLLDENMIISDRLQKGDSALVAALNAIPPLERQDVLVLLLHDCVYGLVSGAYVEVTKGRES